MGRRAPVLILLIAAGYRALDISKTCGLAARPRQARNKAAADRIGDGSENDRDSARLLQQRLGGWMWLTKERRRAVTPHHAEGRTCSRRVPNMNYCFLMEETGTKKGRFCPR